VIALGTLAAASALCADEASTPARLTESSSTAHAATSGTLDHRFKVLAKALELDARQQAELWQILNSQRQTVRKIWSDPALLSAERVPATRAVEERTADEIRAILTEDQKKRYNPPKPQGAAPAPPNVEAWMDAARGAKANP